MSPTRPSGWYAARRGRLTGAAGRLAADQDGVASRRQLRAVGVDKALVHTQVRAGRWRTHGQRTVAVHTGDLGPVALRWRGVWEAGADAALDAVSALQAAGLTGYEEARIQVSVSHGRARARARPDGVRVIECRWRTPADLMGAGIPRVRPEVAAVRAALWARSERQAALLLVMTAQQRLTTPSALRRAFSAVPRVPRRAFVGRVVDDIVDGARALGELDFASLCRARGLPEPSRQVVRRGPRGRIYLDVCWEDVGLVVEVDGIHHGLGLAPVEDALRQNEVTLQRDLVLRVPLLGLRLDPDAFLDQVARAYWHLAGVRARDAGAR